MTEGSLSEATGSIYVDRVTGTKTEKKILRTVAALVDWALDEDGTDDCSAHELTGYPRSAGYCNQKQDFKNALGLSGFPMIWKEAVITSHHLQIPDENSGYHVYVSIRSTDMSWLVRVCYVYHPKNAELNTVELLETWGMNYDLALEWFTKVEKHLAEF